MTQRAKFARFGRPIIYTFVSMMLLPVLLSITAPQVVAVVGTLLDNFENVGEQEWTYNEVDAPNTMTGTTTSEWKTQGENSYKLWKTRDNTNATGDYCEIYKNIDLSDISHLYFDARLFGNRTMSANRARVYISGALEWEKDFGSFAEYLGETIDVSGYTGTENIVFRLYLGGNLDSTENEAFYIDNLRDVSPWQVELRWESNYALVEDSAPENKLENGIDITFFMIDNSVQKFTMTMNPENFAVDPNIEKIRVDVTYDNYWRTRIIPPDAENATVMIIVDNVEDLDQYEFTLGDLTGLFGIEYDGQLWFSRYIDNQLQVHEDYWDAEESVTAFLVYGGEYSLMLVTSDRERSVGRITADGILTKEIAVSKFILPDPLELWDDVAWSTWWSDNDLKVSYQDNVSKTDNATVNIYDENDNQVHTETFSTNEWTLTWAGANENNHYAVELNLNHQTHGSSIVRVVLSPSWTPPLEDEDVIPGIGQLGDLPFAWGAGVAAFLALVIALTFGARHAGFCVMTMGLMLIALGPIMGVFTASTEVIALIAFLMVMGVIMMLTKKGD